MEKTKQSYESPELIELNSELSRIVRGETSSGLPGGDSDDHDIF